MKNKAFKIFLSIVYLIYVYLMISGKIRWNLWTFYISLLAAWFLVCSWLPFNAKNYKTTLAFKLAFASIQAITVFIFAGAMWQVFNLQKLFVTIRQSVPFASSAQTTHTAKEMPLPEELPAQDTAAPADVSPEDDLPPDFMPPSAQLYVPLGAEKENSLLEEVKKQRELEAAQAYTKELNLKMQDPLYRQAYTQVHEEITRQDAEAIQGILSQQDMDSINKIIPFSRYPLIKVLIQKHINRIKARIQEAQKQGFPQKEIDLLSQKLNKLEATQKAFLKRHSNEYQQQAINQRLAQLKQKAQ